MKTKSILQKDDYIQEGVNPAPGVLLLACTVGDNEDDPKNRILVRKNDSWLEFGSSGEAVLSIDATADGRATVLGERGTVIEFNWTETTQEKLKASRKLYVNKATEDIGPLRRIRVIEGRVHCVGSMGQIYELQNGRFNTLPALNLYKDNQTIEDIVGGASGEVMAVISEGHVAKFDGSLWVDLPLPIEMNPTAISRVGENSFAVVGKEGKIVVGEPKNWQVIKPLKRDRNYWGVASRGEIVYAAWLGGIDVLRDKNLTPLAIPKFNDLEFTALRSGPDGVWSFAGHTVGLIDANSRWNSIFL